MRHIADGTLRRLGDEPMSVPDRVVQHLARCPRCSRREQAVTEDAEAVRRVLARPRPVPDVDRAWARLSSGLAAGPTPEPAWTPALRKASWRPRRRLSPRAALLAGGLAVVVAGSAAAATVTTIFAPTRVAPVSLGRSDLQSVASVMGLGGSNVLGGFPTASGQLGLAFGSVSWTSAGTPSSVSTPAEAAAAAGFPLALPTRLPAGVGKLAELAVQPQVRATLTFDSRAGALAGSRVDLEAGPAVLAAYGSAGGLGLPTFAVLTMPRPTAQSSGASLAQIESFLLSRPGLPGQLAEEVRLLGDLSTTLPVPVPAGASVHSVQVHGSAGVLVSDASRSVSGLVWEDPHGMLHLLAGLVSPQDLLRVAGELG